MLYCVAEHKCTGCGACLDICPTEAIKMDGKRAVIAAMECTGCGACPRVCPEGAISMVRSAPAVTP